MAEQIPYTVKFPEGDSVSFTAPADMSDGDVYQRAVQERKIKSGQIPTTFMAGAAPEGAQALTQAGMSGAGYLTGNPSLVAAAPLAGRGARALAEKVTGQDVTPTSAAELGTLWAEGIVSGYGPSVVSNIASGLAARTVPRQLANGTWIPGLKGHGILPWAVREGADAASNVAERFVRPVSPQATGETAGEVADMAANAIKRTRLGVSSDDLKLLRDQVATGMRLSTAAKIIAGKDASKAQALMRAFQMGIK